MQELDLSRERKATLRARLKAARAALPAETRAGYSRLIAERLFSMPQIAAAQSVFVFISNGTEVDTHNMISRFIEQDKKVWVPLIRDKNMNASRFRDWQDLRPAQLGILTPASVEIGDGPFDATITPGLGFTVQGDRIGYGAGYYDRWLTCHQTTVKIALSFEIQVVDELPVTESDIPVDAIVTEQRLIEVKSSG